jgi:myo-inositol-1-phosphate synthase
VNGYTTVSAKIPKKLKELIEKYNIKPSQIIRRAIEEEVRKRALEELEGRAKKLSKRLERISEEEIVRLIREDRER